MTNLRLTVANENKGSILCCCLLTKNIEWFLPSAMKLWRLCFYRRVSVHRGEVPDQAPPRTRYTPQDQVHPPRPGTPPQTRYPLDQVQPPQTSYTTPGPGTPLDQVHPPPKIWPLLRTVRILLECILVFTILFDQLVIKTVYFSLGYICLWWYFSLTKMHQLLHNSIYKCYCRI